jgi:hypothetical protein
LPSIAILNEIHKTLFLLCSLCASAVQIILKKGEIDEDVLREGVKTAQERLAQIERGTVQTIPGDLALL